LIDAGRQDFRQWLVAGLFENLFSTVSIRRKQDCPAIWRPGCWKAHTVEVVERQPLVLNQRVAIRGERPNVSGRRPNNPNEDERLSVGTSGNL
jgi:hypothetical protein